jgi:DNA-binding CsgD family transcriptional regulator
MEGPQSESDLVAEVARESSRARRSQGGCGPDRRSLEDPPQQRFRVVCGHVHGDEGSVAEALSAALAHIAGSSEPLPLRARALLEALRPVVPYDAAWLAHADPLRARYGTLASVDLDDHVLDFLSGPVMAHDIAVTGTDQDGLPLSPSDLPFAAEELSSWSDCLIPSGIHESLAVGLFTPGGVHVGFLTLLSRSASPPSRTARRRLASLAPVLARGIDPMPSLLTAARLVRGATAGRILRCDLRTQPLLEMDGDPLLEVGSPVLTVAWGRLADGQMFSSFLWPRGGWHAPAGHVRVSVVAAPQDVTAAGLGGLVLLSALPDLHELTPRELEVLGLMIDGLSNQEIARTLVVAPRTVAAHIEHLLVKLDATTRTLAAVRAERLGLYVPAVARSFAGRGAARERALASGAALP